MDYQLSDEQFHKELWINAYCNQIKGLPVGNPGRLNFQPVLAVFKNSDGTYYRTRTLADPAYTFSAEQKQILLARR